MKNIDNEFERFAEFLEAEDRPGGNITDFKTICKTLGLPLRRLDNYLMNNIGLSGEDVVRSYRTCTPIAFL